MDFIGSILFGIFINWARLRPHCPHHPIDYLRYVNKFINTVSPIILSQGTAGNYISVLEQC